MTTRVFEILQRRLKAREISECVFTNKAGGLRGYQAKGGVTIGNLKLKIDKNLCGGAVAIVIFHSKCLVGVGF